MCIRDRYIYYAGNSQRVCYVWLYYNWFFVFNCICAVLLGSLLCNSCGLSAVKIKRRIIIIIIISFWYRSRSKFSFNQVMTIVDLFLRLIRTSECSSSPAKLHQFPITSRIHAQRRLQDSSVVRSVIKCIMSFNIIVIIFQDYAARFYIEMCACMQST